MKVSSIIIIFLFYPIFSFSQIPAEKIKKDVISFVTDTDSNNYWKTIYEKGISSDYIFTKDELKLFYYSNGFKNVNLRPFPSLNYDQERMRMVELANSNRCRRSIRLAKELIEENPFDLTTLVYLSCCLDSRNSDTENKYFHRMNGMIEAILTTGDGSSPGASIKITSAGDDSIIASLIKFEGHKIGDLHINNNLMSVWESNSGERLYFEYLMIFQ